MNITLREISILATVLLSACTTEAWYEGVQRSAEAECLKRPGATVQDCSAKVNAQRYPEYEQAREKLRSDSAR